LGLGLGLVWFRVSCM